MWMYNYFLNFTSSDGSHGHLNQIEWVTTPLGAYLETGFTAGYNTPNLCSGYCNIPYWEDHNGSCRLPSHLQRPLPACGWDPALLPDPFEEWERLSMLGHLHLPDILDFVDPPRDINHPWIYIFDKTADRDGGP